MNKEQLFEEIDEIYSEWHGGELHIGTERTERIKEALNRAINFIPCCVNKDLEKHPIEGVNEFMLTDQEIEDTQFYCAGVEAGNIICESQCLGCCGFQRDYEQ